MQIGSLEGGSLILIQGKKGGGHHECLLNSQLRESTKGRREGGREVESQHSLPPFPPVLPL